ncbi:hypothetical protein JCM5350_000945 [Sporobolomyces pararoseus]
MSGTRDFLRMAARLYPSSQPPTLSDYRARDPILEGHGFESPASSNKLVHFLEATHSASRQHPPEPQEPRPIAPLPRRIPLPRPRDSGGGSSTATRRLPSSAYNQSSTSTSGSGSRKSGKEVLQTLRGEKRLAKKDKPEWKDLPYSNDFSLDSQFLELPPPVLDRILGNVALNLRDHLALAATCRSIRACYHTSTTTTRYSSLWRALVAVRPPIEQGRLVTRKLASKEIEEKIHKIWSNRLQVDADSMQVIPHDADSDEEDAGEGAVNLNKNKNKKVEGAIRSKEWENAIDLVHTIRISKTEAKKIYKLNESELNKYLSSFAVNSKGAATRLLYLESAVESLALRLHGGVNGHAQRVARAIEIARKKKSTRELNSGFQQRRGEGGDSREGSAESE